MDSTCAEVGGVSGRGSPMLSSTSYYGEALPNSGLPPTVTHSTHHIEDPEVTEIRLSPQQSENGNGVGNGDSEGAQHQEMVETRREPFVPGLGQSQQQKRGEVDAKMEDLREQ